ncbi:DNA topoisomerase [Clostridium fessum]|uniref:DNA topoisomerase n=2 Tax=Clostridium fessum TaxID=2126740 RepID=UPI0022E61EC2|nr:DNA topoisomerase [Clostridium fessum]
MAKSLFIAEKPSVAREFANALKVNGRSVDGYIESENAVVTWCVGHLVTMSYPEVYDMKYKRWSLETLPFLPKEWKYQVIDSVKKQFGIVSGLLNRADVDTIYVCTDSGREGEYIYRLVAQMAGVQGKKQKRVWIDSQTEEEILRGIREAKDLSEYDHLADSAYLRAKEDYLMGINFSRALTLKYGPSVSNYMRSSDRTVISVGRVMTCVLGMVVRREREIREFVKTPFYRVIGTFGPAGISIDGEWRAVEGSRYYGTPCLYKENGFKERKDAEALIAWLWERENGNENSGAMQSEVSDAEKADAGLMGVYNTSQGTILKVEKKKETKNPPLLYNLAELQNDCSKMFKISPDQTLKVVQELYERKLVTYPRTDARVLSTAVAKEISKNIGGLTHYEPLAAFASEAMQAGLWKNIAKTRYVNDKQITDHYAIIPTGQGLGALRSLSELNRKIYQVIVRRFLSIFYSAAVYQKYAVEIEVKGEHFFASFKVLKEAGYLKVAEIPKKKKDTAGESVGRTNRLEPGIDGNDAENPAREADGTDSSQPKVIDASHPEFIQMLEQLKKGMKVSLDDLQIKEGETSPPKRYSSGSMILAMENAGQLIEDEELRAQIKGSGIGTSATRAEILKKLFNIKYMALNEKTQVITPTYLGELIYEVVHTSMKQLLNPELTASWEKGLTYVAEGSITPDEYMQKLERFVIGRTYNAVHMGNTYGLRPAFDAVAVFYQNAEKVSRSRSVKSRGTAKTARTVKAETSSETTSITSGQEQSK